MAPKRKRSTRTSEASEAPAVEENGDSPRMTLRPRKVRVLSPPAHNTRSKHLSQDLDGLEEVLNTPPNKREVAALKSDKSPKTSSEKAVEKDEQQEDVNAKNETYPAKEELAEAEKGSLPVEATEAKEEDAQEEDSDSDAAPEAVSLTKSQADARKRTANQAKAAKDQDTRTKQRRRDRDAKLKSQAEEREKRRKEREEDDERRRKSLEGIIALPQESIVNGINGHVEDDDDLEELPREEIEKDKEEEFDPSTAAFLPQSILDALPTDRSPTPPLSKAPPSTTTLSRNLTLLTKHTHKGVAKLPLPQPPKDVKIAPRTTVSVLQDKRSKYLPPMAQVKGKVVKENWLLGRNTLAGLGGRNLQKGRQGKMGSSKVVRRPWGKTSFA